MHYLAQNDEHFDSFREIWYTMRIWPDVKKKENKYINTTRPRITKHGRYGSACNGYRRKTCNRLHGRPQNTIYHKKKLRTTEDKSVDLALNPLQKTKMWKSIKLFCSYIYLYLYGEAEMKSDAAGTSEK